MNLFKKLFRWLFWRKKKISKPIVEEPDYRLIQNVECITCPKGYSSWNHAAGLPPVRIDDFIRLRCEAANEVDYFTAAIKTPVGYADGKFECEARFNSGKGTWNVFQDTYYQHHRRGGNGLLQHGLSGLCFGAHYFHIRASDCYFQDGIRKAFVRKVLRGLQGI